jgi:asparagine synthase (glutamine-hydrolysing)
MWEGGGALSGSSLLLAALGPRRLDPVGLQEFLYSGVVYEDRTLFAEVRKLGSARVHVFDGGGHRASDPWWRISDLTPDSLSGFAAVDALAASLIAAASNVARLFQRPVCDLTGGYDSRAVVAAFLSAGVPFSVTVSGPGDSPDARISLALATLAGLPHRHLDPPAPTTLEEIGGTVPVTDGECEPFEYARTLEIHRALSEQFDVSINGSFGEVARGYWWELLAPRTGSCRSLPAGRLARKRYAYARFDSSLFRPEDRLDLGDHMTSVVERAVEGLAGYPNTFQMDHAYLALRMQRWQGRIATSTNRLWPCLSPFLFRSVLETMLRTESRLRKRSLLARLLIQKLQPRLAAYPLESGVPAEPLRLRNAHRFGPLAAHYGRRAAEKLFQRRRAAPAGSRPSADRWLRDDERVRSFLDPGEARIGEILDRSALRRFLDASRGDGFAFDEQWRRLLGVECALRLVEKEGAAGGPKSMARG